MSCFLCSNTHTAVIAILAHAPGRVSVAQLRETATRLRQLNDAGLRARYGDSPNPMGGSEMCAAMLDAVDWIRGASVADMLRAAQCFEYQCSEAPDDYPGRAILADVRARLESHPESRADSSVWSI